MVQNLASRDEAGRSWPDPSDRRTATIRLLQQAAHADGANRREIEGLVVELNVEVARDVARRYRGRGIDQEDLEQVACLGLVKAVRGFGADKGHDFLSYAVPTIRGEVRRHFRDRGWMVRPTRSIQEMQASIFSADEHLTQVLGRSPRPREIAAHLGVDLDRVIDALSANGCFVPSSLDAPLPPGDCDELGQALGAEESGFEAVETRAVLDPILATLTDREKLILELRFAHGRTQTEIGAEIGVSQMQVSRLLSATLTKCRAALRTPAAREHRPGPCRR